MRARTCPIWHRKFPGIVESIGTVPWQFSAIPSHREPAIITVYPRTGIRIYPADNLWRNYARYYVCQEDKGTSTYTLVYRRSSAHVHRFSSRWHTSTDKKITRVVASQTTMQNEKKKKKKQKQDRVRCTRDAESSARSLSEISFYVKIERSAVVRWNKKRYRHNEKIYE